MAYVGNYIPHKTTDVIICPCPNIVVKDGIDTVDHVANTWWQVHHLDYDLLQICQIFILWSYQMLLF